VEEMAIRSDLLEHVAHRIITRIFEEIPEVSRIIVAVSNSILLLAVTLKQLL
jgi:dihydroneopterin aldolase